MERKKLDIKFYFPKISTNTKSTEDFVALLMEAMRKDGSIDHAGYLEDEDLKKDLIIKMNGFDRKNYRAPGKIEKKRIKMAIETSIKKCNKKLPQSQDTIFILIFPWLSDMQDKELFGGVDAAATHESVIHIFIDIGDYKITALDETVAHEYNHILFYYYQGMKKYTILEHVIIEGLAENFREEIMGGGTAPWAVALREAEAKKIFLGIQTSLKSKNIKRRRNILFGNKKYKKWTGYSIGYWLVKEFRKKNPLLSWKDILQLDIHTSFDLK